MNITLEKANANDKDTVSRLFQLFAHDTSELSGMDIGDDGLYHGLNDMDDYTSKENYRTYLIKADHMLAGVAVVRFDDDANYLRHFFVLRKFRSKKIGFKSASMIFDLFQGKWRVSTMDYNIPAIKFWDKVCNAYSNNEYCTMRRDDNKGPQYEFEIK